MGTDVGSSNGGGGEKGTKLGSRKGRGRKGPRWGVMRRGGDGDRGEDYGSWGQKKYFILGVNWGKKG